MKTIGFGLAAIICIAPFASATPVCTTGTLATYETLGSTGCTIGTNTVFGFNVPSGTSGATDIASAGIQIMPSGGTTSPTLEFTASSMAANGDLLEALIDYSISGNDYTSDSITLAGTSSSGNGAVTDIQNYCLGGSFDSSGVLNCSTGKTGDLLLLGNGSDSTSFAATPFLNVTHDFTLDSGGVGIANTASGGMITDSYKASPAAIPEPRMFLPVAAGLLLVMLRNKKRSFAKEEGK